MLRLSSASLSIIASLMLCTAAGAATNAEAPRRVIDDAMQQVLQILKTENLDLADRKAKIENVAYANFDFDRMSKLVLARNRRAMTPAQFEEFRVEFRKHLSLTYGSRLNSYNDEKIEVGAAEERRNGTYAVKTTIVGGKADGAVIEYRLREVEGKWLVFDVIIEGVSLIGNFRSQIQDIISSKGIEQLNQLLRERNEEREREATTEAAAAS